MTLRSTLGSLLLSLTMVAAPSCGGNNGSGSGELTLEGVVTAVDARSLEDIRSFTLRSDGRDYEILLRDGADYAFPPQHLHEHVISAAPVRVEVERDGDRLVAVYMDDA